MTPVRLFPVGVRGLMTVRVKSWSLVKQRTGTTGRRGGWGLRVLVVDGEGGVGEGVGGGARIHIRCPRPAKNEAKNNKITRRLLPPAHPPA
eukprot:73333-Hanusia_phi.AAC.1